MVHKSDANIFMKPNENIYTHYFQCYSEILRKLGQNILSKS